MTRLVPLKEIPGSRARRIEATARREHTSRAEALDAAQWEIVDAEGTYWGAYPPSRGWLLTEPAARAVAAQEAHPPGNTSHPLYRAVRR